MKRYTEYKDSGLEWLGIIPKHWITNKFCRVSYMKGRIGWQGLKQSEFVNDDSMPYLITGMNFKNGVINWEEVYHISEERYAEAPEIQLQKDDVLMTKDGTIGKLLYVDHLPNKASLNSHLLVLRPLNNEYIPRYIYYQLQSEHFKNHVEQVKTGTTFYGITQEGTGQFKVLLPPIPEQSQIAAFLDHKTKQINDLIDKKQKIIELLKEEHTAIINQAVTKGFDPNVFMKDSGVEWLGKIPEHWELRKIGRSFNIIGSGTTPTSGREEFYENGNIPWVLTGDLNDNYLSKTSKSLTEKAFGEHSALKKFPVGSLVIAMYGATIGRLSILRIEATTNQACCVLAESTFFSIRFLFYWFLSNRSNIISLSYGGGQPNISQEIIRNIKVPCPSLKEQSEIVRYLDHKCNSIDISISHIKKEIQLISDYKTSLINEAVTGKIDVRN
jgi:type I restriction enzyme, S subunit